MHEGILLPTFYGTIWGQSEPLEPGQLERMKRRKVADLKAWRRLADIAAFLASLPEGNYLREPIADVTTERLSLHIDLGAETELA